MKRNLLYKWLFIAAVILICVGGILGLPRSLRQARENAARHVHLGLDLRGGTHLILQVQVDDAVNAETEQAADRLKELLRSRNIGYDEVQRSGVGQILVRGIPPDKVRDFEELLGSRFEQVWERSRAPQDPILTLRVRVPSRGPDQSLLNCQRGVPPETGTQSGGIKDQ